MIGSAARANFGLRFPATGPRARLAAVAAFAGTVGALGYGGATAYHVLTDALVSPISLSSDNDLVIQSKLGLSRAIAERHALAARVERNRASTQATETAVMRLEALRAQAGRALEALGARRTSARATPETLAQRDQLVRIDLDLLDLKAELRGKMVQARVDAEQLATTDELVSKMMARPIFRAASASQSVAFVPYTQLPGVQTGADVHQCSVWGLLDCHPVGQVAEVVPGEVMMPDPSGALARGQYLLLTLFESSAAQAETLRVRKRADQPAPVAMEAEPASSPTSPP
jgi:hypothetical protein